MLRDEVSGSLTCFAAVRREYFTAWRSSWPQANASAHLRLMPQGKGLAEYSGAKRKCESRIKGRSGVVGLSFMKFLLYDGVDEAQEEACEEQIANY